MRLPVTPEVRVDGDRVVILFGPGEDYLELDMHNAHALALDLELAVRKLRKP